MSTTDTAMFCTKCRKTVQSQGACPKGGNHHLVSISDKGTQGQGQGTGPESTKNNKPDDPHKVKHGLGKDSVLARVASRYDAIRHLAMQFVAHDSGDGQTVYHCGRGSERFWTYDGLKTLAETAGTVQRVLTNTGSGGVWRDAMIHSFGEQKLLKVTLRRNKQTKVTWWTPEHRWLLRGGVQYRTVETKDLRAGDRLAYLLPKSAIAQSRPSTFGIAQGVTFGDGTQTTQGCVVRLWGDKDLELLKYFNDSVTYPEKTPNGVEGVRVCDLPNGWKQAPSLDQSVSFLYGWLAGYFAADGSVSGQGQAILYSSDRSYLEFAQLVAARLGIATYDITTKVRRGYGMVSSTIHSIQFVNSTLRSEFFLIAEHRSRYLKAVERGNSERLGWTVVSVEDEGLVEEVFCPRVLGPDNFVLDGWVNTRNCPFCGGGNVTGRSDGTIECGFCETHFTVQVQPAFAGMPQTVNGVPYDMPGMPGGVDPNTGLPPDGMDAGMDEEGALSPEGAPPDAEMGSPADEEEQGKNGTSVPWEHQSKLASEDEEMAMYRHLTGVHGWEHNGLYFPTKSVMTREHNYQHSKSARPTNTHDHEGLPASWQQHNKQAKLYHSSVGDLSEDQYIAHLALIHSP